MHKGLPIMSVFYLFRSAGLRGTPFKKSCSRTGEAVTDAERDLSAKVTTEHQAVADGKSIYFNALDENLCYLCQIDDVLTIFV